MRHVNMISGHLISIGFLGLTVVNGTPRNWDVTAWYHTLGP